MKIIKNMSKSVYPVRYNVKGSFNLGEICPIGAPLEVIPGDYFKLEAAIALRMATPIAPIMDDLDAEITAHFVPLRLVSSWNGDITLNSVASNVYPTSEDRFEAIIGNGLGNPGDWTKRSLEAYTTPKKVWDPTTAKAQAYTTIGEALGLGLSFSDDGNLPEVLAYPLYGYNLIYQERFRNENVEAGRTLQYTSNLYGAAGDPTDTTDDAALAGTYNQSLSVAYKHGDYFTNGVPSPTKGGPVELPLGNLAPVVVEPLDQVAHLNASIKEHAQKTGNMLKWINNTPAIKQASSNTVYRLAIGDQTDLTNKSSATIAKGTTATTDTGDTIFPANLFADLSTATAATMDNFIMAYNIQRLLMNDIKGTRYYEVIKNHYGIVNEDIKLYVPELLNYRRFAINVSTVVQQSGSAASTSATDQGNFLGTTGGYSFTGNKGSMVHHAFGEFGYIYFLIVCRQRRTYGNGIPRMYLRNSRFDFFFPELGRVGYREIKEIELDADTNTPNKVYAYTPSWEELRRRGINQAFGFLNPTKSNSLDYWTLAEDLVATPTLSMSWLKEDRTNLARALTIGSTGPDFIMDALIYGKVSTFVPIGNTPKLFD